MEVVEEVKGRKTKVLGWVRSSLKNKDIAPGDRLPTIREISERLNVGSYSVRQAITELRKEGLVTARQGRGIFVSSDYSPNKTLKNNNTNHTYNKTLNLGIFSAFDGGNQFSSFAHPQTTAGILAKSHELQAKSHIVAPNVDFSTSQKILEQIEREQFDGIIWLYPNNIHWPILETLSRKSIPTVITSHSACISPVYSVRTDELTAGIQIVKKMVDLGCQKLVVNWDPVAIKDLSENSGTQTAGHSGFKFALEKAILDYDNKLVLKDIICADTPKEYYSSAQKALSQADQHTAVFFGNTSLFGGFLRDNWDQFVSVFSKSHLVVATGNNQLNDLTELAKEIDFSVMLSPLAQIGRIAVQKLVNIIEGRSESQASALDIELKESQCLVDSLFAVEQLA